MEPLVNALNQVIKLEPRGPQFVNKSLMPLCNTVSKINDNKQDAINVIQQSLDDYLKIVSEYVGVFDTPVEMVTKYNEEWIKFKVITSILLIALPNLFFTPKAKNEKPNDQTVKSTIKNMCYTRWRTSLIEPLVKPLQTTAHKLLADYRNAALFDKVHLSNEISMVKSIVDSYCEIDPTLRNYYIDGWEVPFLANTIDYYTQITSDFISKESISSYLMFCNGILDLEDRLDSMILHKNSVEKHRKIVNDTIIIAYKSLLESALLEYVMGYKKEELKYIFRLFERIKNLEPLLELLTNNMEQVFSKVFQDLLQDHENQDKGVQLALPQKYCCSFLEKYNHFKSIIEDSFENNPQFVHAIEKTGRKILNNNAINTQDLETEPSAKNIIKYSNELLNNSKLTIQELTNQFDHLPGIILLFQLLGSKDVFCKGYKIMFCARLLKNVINKDAEMYMINELKSVHDLQFTQELSVMMNDINMSKEKYGVLSNFLTDINTTNITIDPVVITLSVWPLNQYDLNTPLNLPQELVALSDAFVTKYKAANEGRDVDWLHERSSGMVELKAKGKTYRITFNHFQLAVILCLSKKPAMSETSILQSVGMQSEWLTATLKSLIGIRIVQQNPTNKSYRLNPGFEAKMLALNAIPHFNRPVVENSVDPDIEENREMNTQASIVRIMKSRRVLGHAELCDEVIKQTSRFFPQKIERIKRQIEKLINGTEKYLERQDKNTYKYVTGADL